MGNHKAETKRPRPPKWLIRLRKLIRKWAVLAPLVGYGLWLSAVLRSTKIGDDQLDDLLKSCWKSKKTLLNVFFYRR